MQDEFSHRVRSGEDDPEKLQVWLLEERFTTTKARIQKWIDAVPGQVCENVHDLPEDVLSSLKNSFQERAPKCDVIDFVARLGYRVNAATIDKWFGQLLREAQKTEIAGEVGPNGVSLQQEFETRTLTWTLDFFLSLISDVELQKPELKTVGDFERIANVVLRAIQVSIARRKLDLEEKGVLERVRAEFRSEIQKKLSGRPDVVQALYQAIDEATDTIRGESAKTGSC